jgi:hypothetical protein
MIWVQTKHDRLNDIFPFMIYLYVFSKRIIRIHKSFVKSFRIL